MKVSKLDPFLGENNRLVDHKLWTKDGAFVRHAVNVDITETGGFTRRKGTTKVYGGADCHSLWTGSNHTYFVDYDTLYRIDKIGATVDKTAMVTVSPGKRVSYTDTPIGVICSDGSSLWNLTDGSLAGVESPRSTPKLTASATGSLTGGMYQVTVSFVAPNGEESGALAPVSIEVPDNGAITLSQIPQSAGLSTCVYLTSVNGDNLFRHELTTSTTLTLSVAPNPGAVRCQTMLLTRMPPGQIVAYLNGRLFVASGQYLFYSEPYGVHLFDPSKNYIPFTENVTMVEPCQNGLYVSADQTYWVAGDIEKAELSPVLPYRAILSTSQPTPNANTCWWMSERGTVVGGQNGDVKNLQETTVAVEPALVGASLYREQDGLKQMVSSLFSPQQTVTAASSYMDAEVIRKDTPL